MDSRHAAATLDVERDDAHAPSSDHPADASPATVCSRHLDIERGPNWLFVRVKPCWQGAPSAASLAEQVVAALDQHFINRVVLEFDEARLPCDRLIEELRVLDRSIQSRHGVLRLCGLPADYTRRFDRAHLGNQFPLYHDREDAVWAGHHPCQPR
jgi:hypothetical protein